MVSGHVSFKRLETQKKSRFTHYTEDRPKPMMKNQDQQKTSLSKAYLLTSNNSVTLDYIHKYY